MIQLEQQQHGEFVVGGVGWVADTNYLYPAPWGWIKNNFFLLKETCYWYTTGNFNLYMNACTQRHGQPAPAGYLIDSANFGIGKGRLYEPTIIYFNNIFINGYGKDKGEWSKK